MDALEEYYQNYLMNYSDWSNCEGYDMDEQFTKDRVEKILEAGYMTDEDVEFVRSLLPDVENERIREEIVDYIERVTAL